MFPTAGKPPAEGSPEADKSSDQQSVLVSVVRHNFLFRGLEPDTLRKIVGAMKRIVVTEGQEIMRQGAKADFFYVAESGLYEVYQSEAGAIERPQHTVRAGNHRRLAWLRVEERELACGGAGEGHRVDVNGLALVDTRTVSSRCAWAENRR